MVSVSARRELVRHMVSHGLSERRSLRVIGMSASAYRYEPAQDRNCALKKKIVALAQRHRRYGAGMIYLKLGQSGELVNHKRVDRLYVEAGLQVKKRRRKKNPMSDRHPLERPTAANQVWSMDFVFDRTAEGRSIKSLTYKHAACPSRCGILAQGVQTKDITGWPDTDSLCKNIGSKTS